MALRFATNNFRTAMRRRNFASAAAASEKGFIEKFVPVEVYPLVVAIGGAVVLCTAACTRYLATCPDVTWGKGIRGKLQKGPELQGSGKTFGSHRHGWDTGSNLLFGNGNGYGKKNYNSEGDNFKLFE